MDEATVRSMLLKQFEHAGTNPAIARDMTTTTLFSISIVRRALRRS
jgi:hypothetical protein